MDLANFWIAEKQLVHKLFKVLVPRYQEYTTSFTKLHKAPNIYPGSPYERAILELKGKLSKGTFEQTCENFSTYFYNYCTLGNIYPSVEQYNPYEYNLLHNVLLNAAKKEYRMEKYKEIAENIKQ